VLARLLASLCHSFGCFVSRLSPVLYPRRVLLCASYVPVLRPLTPHCGWLPFVFFWGAAGYCVCISVDASVVYSAVIGVLYSSVVHGVVCFSIVRLLRRCASVR